MQQMLWILSDPVVQHLPNFDYLSRLSLLACFSVESGEKDTQELVKYREEYDVIITWIINNEKRLQELKDDDSGDDETLRNRRLIIEVLITFSPYNA